MHMFPSFVYITYKFNEFMDDEFVFKLFTDESYNSLKLLKLINSIVQF